MLELPCIGFRYTDGPSVCMRDGGDGSRITPHVSPHCHHMKNCLFVRRVHASRYQILSHTAFPYFCFSDYVPFSWHPSVRFVHGKSEPQNSAPLYMFLPNGSAASSKQPSLAAAVACAKNGRLQLILPIFFDYLSRKPVESRQE